MPSLLDQRLFLWLNADRGLPWLDRIMAIFSSLDFWLPFMVLAAGLVLWKGGFRGRAMLVCLLLSIALMEGLFIKPLKSAFGRPRPNETLPAARSIDLAPAVPRLLAATDPLRIRPAKINSPPRPGKSFPSGHTANMFCFATILTLFYWPRGAWFYLAATLVAVSRVMTGSHWPSDVLLTALLVVPLTAMLVRVYCVVWKRVVLRTAPQLAAKHPELIPGTT